MYNAGRWIAACLNSIRRQELESWECLLIDDGSTDDTLARAWEFHRRDARFRVLRQDRLGIVAALDHGLRAAEAPLIARMDADDLMAPSRLRLQRDRMMKDDDLSLLGTHVRFFPRDRLRDGNRRYEAWLNTLESDADIRAQAYIECPIAHPTWMARRRVLNMLRWRETSWAEDYDLLLRLLQAGHRAAVLPRPLHAWRLSDNRTSQVDERYALSAFQHCRAHYLASGPLAASTDYVLWGFGSTGRHLFQALKPHGRRPRWIVDVHPGRMGQRIHGATVIPHHTLSHIERLPIIVSVAGRTPRRRIRNALNAMGFAEGIDFWFAA